MDLNELILVGWKAIANCLGVCTKTAKKYAKYKDLPIRRGLKQPRAFVHELKEWHRELDALERKRRGRKPIKAEIYSPPAPPMRRQK